MDKVRFSCPRCTTVMQTGSDKIGIDVVCPQCRHEFRLVDNELSGRQSESQLRYDADAPTMPPQQGFQNPLANTDSTSESTPSNSRIGSTGGNESWANSGKSQVPQSLYSTGDADPYSRSSQTGFTCPYCGTSRPPLWKSEVSQLGWVVFAILLVTTCLFCFVGLFIRDRYRVCSNCKVRLE